ncbi:MAG: hypothetical protein D6693_01295 [Planctomycetota bacterium]|nr:MAG: hypothetical protein D6693_01295 [Planctomycetota bacterium]
MTRRRARWIGLAALAVGGGVFVSAVLAMSQRLRRLRDAEPVALHYFIPISADEFEYLGRPVRFETITPEGRPAFVRVRYGEATAALPILGLDVPALGPIERHQDWMRVLLLAGEAGESADPARLMRDGGAGSRLIVAARGPAPGLDADTWGEAHYKDWVYTIITFDPDGSLDEQRVTYRDLLSEQHSWRFAAAMNVTPALHTPAMRSSSPISYPNFGPVRRAYAAMGWTWPAAGVGALGVMVGLLVLGASLVKTPAGADPAA